MPAAVGILIVAFGATSFAASADDLFQTGTNVYRIADFAGAAAAFRESTIRQPAAGTFLNLGNAEWRRGRTGTAILAWERALWLNPFQTAARNNLRFARTVAQLEAPSLVWHEVGSAWLPANWWAWITAVALWLVTGALLLPAVLRMRRSGWHQALAALALTSLLLTLPAHSGIRSRSQIGLVLTRDTPLRLTPTREAQIITRLASGEPARLERTRGNYLFIQTSRAAGWVERGQFERVCPE